MIFWRSCPTGRHGASPTAPSAQPDLKLNWNFFGETWNVIAMVKARTEVFQAILGISWFWLLGVVFVTQIPLFTLDSLKGTEAIATVIFALFSVMIGLWAQSSATHC